MTQIVHVQTTIQTIFGVLDDDGNVIPQQPVVVDVGRFKSEAFAEAYAVIANARDEAVANMRPESDGAVKRTRTPARTKKAKNEA